MHIQMHTNTHKTIYLHLGGWNVPSEEMPGKSQGRWFLLFATVLSLLGLVLQTWNNKSFHHRWLWAFFRGMWFIDCSYMLTYLGLCVVFLPVLLSINAISCYTEREMNIPLSYTFSRSEEKMNRRWQERGIEEGGGEPTWRNMGGELPWFGLPPQLSGCGEQHCSQRRWWTCAPG